jgi:hypothetical protein
MLKKLVIFSMIVSSASSLLANPRRAEDILNNAIKKTLPLTHPWNSTGKNGREIVKFLDNACNGRSHKACEDELNFFIHPMITNLIRGNEIDNKEDDTAMINELMALKKAYLQPFDNDQN